MAKKQQWPADKVERRNVADLIPYARNSRKHSEAQIAQIAASIKEWGWTVPVLIEPGGGIIAGHGRVMAAQKLGIDEVPCMIAEGWSDAQKRAYVIADNKLALNAEWDEDVLRVELEELQGLDFDIELTGFEAIDFDENQESQTSVSSLIGEERLLLLIECKTEQEQKTLFDEMNERGFETKIMS